ncbi:MAG: AGE family epimerase/isomerase [Lachnospiraceae bacterium]|nr:AGE family epimerase/isomerase [Lachnospiraceae bacterium]
MDMEMRRLAEEHLRTKLLPFWKRMRDEKNGGFYGYMDFDLNVDEKAQKGCILNSRILWFFSNAAMVLKDPSLLEYADHAYRFMMEHCIDREYGGVYWSVHYDGSRADATKHTYNQAFAVYALASYYDATGKKEALLQAYALMELIEGKCTDEIGYLEAFDRSFSPVENDKLSENGVIAEKTMNTLLHVFEAYTEVYRVAKYKLAAERLRFMMNVIAKKIYNPEKRRQEVFFDREMNSIIDLHSYGHDIETAWLVDRGLKVLGDTEMEGKLSPITRALTARIYERAYVDHSLLNECERGVDNTSRIWWVQAEAVIGFYNGWQETPEHTEYLAASEDIFRYIMENLVDPRADSEWYWELDQDKKPSSRKPIVEPWKCPYHNGRMCMELIKRAK